MIDYRRQNDRYSISFYHIIPIMSHATHIEKYQGTMEELSVDIGNLDYDAQVKLYTLLSQKYEKDAKHDLELNHPQVSEYLQNISHDLADMLQKHMTPLANLCREYNKKGIK